MTTDITHVLRSTVHDNGTVSVTLETAPMPEPAPHEVVVRVDATPINPSDLGTLLAGADRTTLTGAPTGLNAVIPAASVGALAGRLGKPVAVGNEGAGISEALLSLSDHELTIPMAEEVDSLNVGAATAVLLYAAGGLSLPALR